MKLNLSTLTADDLLVANTPEVGAESVVKITDREFQRLFLVRNTNDSGSDIAAIDGVTFPLVLSENRDLHLRADACLKYDADIVVELTCVMSDDTSVQAFATLNVPDWADDTINSIPIGSAVDFVDASGDPLALEVKSITDVAAITGGRSGLQNGLSIWSSPSASQWDTQGCTRNKNFDLVIPSSISIACRYNASAFVKKGRSEEPTLELEYVYFSAWEGIGRLNGGRSSILVEVVKDDSVPWERIVFTGHRPNGSPTRGDGDDEVVATSSGPYENFLVFSSR
jgi:hypothetical protein